MGMGIKDIPTVNAGNYSDINNAQALISAQAKDKNNMATALYTANTYANNQQAKIEANQYNIDKTKDQFRNNLRDRMAQINQLNAQMMNGSMA
jgi:hypothetical protein